MKPDFIRFWREIEAPAAPPQASEDFGFASELSAAAGINHFRAAHLRIPPGRRAYPPMAMDDLEIFAFVLEGAPDLWADGHLHGLREGDGAALNARTGLSHTLINNTDRDARVFVMTEAFRRNSRAHHPMDEAANEALSKMGMLWNGAPKRKHGPHDGKPGSIMGRKRSRPDYVANWNDILQTKAKRYPDSAEDQGIDAAFGNIARFSRIGLHLEILKPGRRTSYPHAERDEDEFVYVVAGKVDVWTDGHITPVGESGFIGWPGGTGITHVVINNSDADAVLIVGGEASRAKNKFWYPYHPSRNKAAAKNYWDDHPVPKLGPHDGLPDALRERLPARARRNALTANTAALTAKKRG
jgi:uncharacterized cupin superfamily protein